MSMWIIATLVLLIGGVAPAALVSARGGPTNRLAGLQQLGMVTTLVLLLLAQAVERSDYITVALVLVLLAFAGGLVYARLLTPRK